MSMPWAEALDAEVAYRQQRVRRNYHRKVARGAAQSTPRTSTRRSGYNALVALFRPAAG